MRVIEKNILYKNVCIEDYYKLKNKSAVFQKPRVINSQAVITIQN